MHLTPQCRDCSTATERIEVEEVWRCTAPDCTRRTYGTGNPDDALSAYTETCAVFICHGTDEVDVKATAELAAQDGPDQVAALVGAAQDGPDEGGDLVDQEQLVPAAGAPVPESARGTVRVPGASGRGNVLPQWGPLPGVESAPDPEDFPMANTDSDGRAGREPRRPQPGVGHGALLPDTDPSPLGQE
ncbi:hypothetical protein [Streptomyces sp. Wb2n-11]|uniref:hypothetical protein n=1 Tax=Streptomyces sp. Wb2n-11 TaxID=1030533 RepID=UPI000B14851E|nr:hypothetical protein [Streptomyces sp. Wb2n-11]